MRGEQLLLALRSRRTATVALLSFSSGLPLGLVWYAIPDWMRSIGVDIRVVGWLTLAQAPWAFKVVWSPLVDRFAPPLWGRRRGWIALTQIALTGGLLILAGVGHRPEAVWVVGAAALAIAVASATQDIAIDAYAVDVLRPDEQGAVVGVRAGLYRVAMIVSGGAAITAAARIGWPMVNVLLALVYVPLLVLTRGAPEPDVVAPAPATLVDAVWRPLHDVLSRPRAMALLGFVVLYKLPDQLAQALVQPFLIDMGYGAVDRGIALAGVSAVVAVAGTLAGGWMTTLVGLGPALWVCGLLQVFSNLGFVLLARNGAPNVPLMYGATSFEQLTTGLGSGAFSVLLLRMTAKQFSATQYALFSSLFAIPRALVGPATGLAVAMVGWSAFFMGTMVLGVPGLVMLAHLAPRTEGRHVAEP